MFFLFPNRFSEVDPGINDFYRQYLYPEKDFDPGGMELLEVRDGGAIDVTRRRCRIPACRAARW